LDFGFKKYNFNSIRIRIQGDSKRIADYEQIGFKEITNERLSVNLSYRENKDSEIIKEKIKVHFMEIIHRVFYLKYKIMKSAATSYNR
jgi:hypothetical protein